MSEKLGKYEEKRDFSRTPEPGPRAGPGEGPLTFVVQKHRARQLHYDFRLELDGVLKSWSAPKGPSADPALKHLAVMVEDHPLGYASFEGVIPKGEYGAGEVIVWDRGTYSPDEQGKLLFNNRTEAGEELRKGLEKGKISIFLRGHKLKGSWTLVKIRKTQNDWLLIKHGDEYAQSGSDILKEERSVLSGRTLDDVKAAKPPVPPFPAPLDPKEIPGVRVAPFPATTAPMLAHLAERPFASPEWIFEPKLDGYRIIAQIKNGKVSLVSRNGTDVTGKYDVLVPGLSRQPASELVLDGEVIAMDERGRQCFQCLQNYLRSLQVSPASYAEPVALIYYVFDILYLDGYDLRDTPLRHRKGLLQGILRSTEQVRLVDYFEADGETVYQAALKSGLEGVVAKYIESRYEAGKRSRNWLKIKSALSDDFVICGYTAGEGARSDTFGALVLGYFDDKGEMKFAGHVGTGFDEAGLVEMKKRLDELRTEGCPFSETPPLNAPATWVRPELVAEVKFTEWTEEGRLRIPVFLRLRQDKPAAGARKTEIIIPPGAPEPDAAQTLEKALRDLQKPGDGFAIHVEGHRILLTNMDKALWPAAGASPQITKRHLLTYLAGASPYLLPHLKDRPLTLNRYPGGIHGEHFYQKHWGNPIPEFVHSVSIRSSEAESSGEYLICNNLPTILWLGQIANLEFHTWFSRISPEPDMRKGSHDADHLLDYPDFIVFDLDPYLYSGKEPAGAEPELNREAFAKVCEVALHLKEVLDELSLASFVKTSGRTGLHIHVPIVRSLNYKAARSAAETIGKYLQQRHPVDITMDWAVEKRSGKVFIDYSQNVRGKTLACAYSPRPAPEAPVSTPLRWNELGAVYPTDFTILNLPARLARTGDLWAGVLTEKRDLRTLLDKV